MITIKKILLYSVTICCFITNYTFGEEEGHFSRLREILDKESMTESQQRETTKGFIQSLNLEEFKDILREIANQSEYRDEDEGVAVGMVIFAKYFYGDKPHQKVSISQIIEQLNDPTLPISWKYALLDVAQLDNKELLEFEIVATNNALVNIAQDAEIKDLFRIFCLKKSQSILYTQLEIVAEKLPSNLKKPLMEQRLNYFEELLTRNQSSEFKLACVVLEEIQKHKNILKTTCEGDESQRVIKRARILLNEWENISKN